MDIQHVWTIYQAIADMEGTLITDCLWRYERFENPDGKTSEATGAFTLDPTIPIESFKEFHTEALLNLISAMPSNSVEGICFCG